MGGKRGASPGQVARGKSGYRILAVPVRPPLNKVMGASGEPAWGKSRASRPGQVRGKSGHRILAVTVRPPYLDHENPLQQKLFGEIRHEGKWGASGGKSRYRILAGTIRLPLLK